jgi:hypothetical protein
VPGDGRAGSNPVGATGVRCLSQRGEAAHREEAAGAGEVTKVPTTDSVVPRCTRCHTRLITGKVTDVCSVDARCPAAQAPLAELADAPDSGSGAQ